MRRFFMGQMIVQLVSGPAKPAHQLIASANLRDFSNADRPNNDFPLVVIPKDRTLGSVRGELASRKTRKARQRSCRSSDERSEDRPNAHLVRRPLSLNRVSSLSHNMIEIFHPFDSEYAV